jgi:Spy/CpxP family protein refolding chaperone
MMARRIVTVAAVALVLVVSGSALAKKKGKGGPPQGGDAVRFELMKHLYPIELVRHFAAELDLSEAQVNQLRKLVKDVQIEIEDLKWGLSKETRALLEMVADGATKEQVYAQLDKIFVYENKIKKKQLGLLICIRDVLTKKQRKVLDKVKEEHMKQGPPPGPPQGPPGPPPQRGWGGPQPPQAPF